MTLTEDARRSGKWARSPFNHSKIMRLPMTKILVLYYSSYGHIEQMAQAVADGARESGADVVIKRVPEIVHTNVAGAYGFKLDQAALIAVPDELDRKSTSLNSSHECASRVPSSACT